MPVNSPYLISDITRWQPLLESSGNGYFNIQEHVFASSRNRSIIPTSTNDIEGFYSNFSTISSPYPAQAKLVESDLSAMMAEADQVIKASAGLTDRQKMVAELFDAKLIAFGYGAAINLATRKNLTIFDLASPRTCALWDATLASWAAKMSVDAIRPVSLIRFLFGNQTISAWGGSGKGTQAMKGASFNSYLRTMPHSDFPSGTACICVAYAEWAEMASNSPGQLHYSFHFPAGSSAREPSMTPARDLDVGWNTTESFINECSMSRLYAGVHFQPSIEASKRMCRGIGRKSFLKIKNLLEGRDD